MSDRIRTSRTGETIIKRLMVGLDPDQVAEPPEKWKLMRLALAVSLRMPVHGGDQPDDLRQADRSGGSEYRLKQVTGEGKAGANGTRAEDEDLTDTLRAMLGVLHGKDLFHPDHRESTFINLLEYHIERGLQEIQRQWTEGMGVADVLLPLLAPPERAITEAMTEVAMDRLVSGFW